MMTFIAARVFSVAAAIAATATIAFASAPVPQAAKTMPIEIAGLAVSSIAA